jgi:hypothetical protein
MTRDLPFHEHRGPVYFIETHQGHKVAVRGLEMFWCIRCFASAPFDGARCQPLTVEEGEAVLVFLQVSAAQVIAAKGGL